MQGKHRAMWSEANFTEHQWILWSQRVALASQNSLMFSKIRCRAFFHNVRFVPLISVEPSVQVKEEPSYLMSPIGYFLDYSNWFGTVTAESTQIVLWFTIIANTQQENEAETLAKQIIAKCIVKDIVDNTAYVTNNYGISNCPMKFLGSNVVADFLSGHCTAILWCTSWRPSSLLRVDLRPSWKWRWRNRILRFIWTWSQRLDYSIRREFYPSGMPMSMNFKRYVKRFVVIENQLSRWKKWKEIGENCQMAVFSNFLPFSPSRLSIFQEKKRKTCNKDYYFK